MPDTWSDSIMHCDVAVIGGGIAGLATAARLQSAGLVTTVFEAHGQPGGCAGYFRRRGFSFDVGATTLVDFEPGGVGGELLEEIGMEPVRGERLPGYVAWLPDRRVTLYRDRKLWEVERLNMLGATSGHRLFWRLIDTLSDVFWEASRQGVKLPIQNLTDVVRVFRCIGFGNLSKVMYRSWTMGDALRRSLRCQVTTWRNCLNGSIPTCVEAELCHVVYCRQAYDDSAYMGLDARF